MPGSRRFSTGHLGVGVVGRLVAMVGSEVVGPALASFVALLAAGALLAITGRLLDPSLRAGSPRSAVTAVVILGLACLGAPIHLGNLTVRGLPLGGLALFATALVWSVQRPSRTASDPAPRPREPRGGPWVAVPLAALAAISAWAFRLAGPTPVSVDALGATGLAALWGALFGGLGRLTRRRGRRLLPGNGGWWRRSDALRQGLRAGVAMVLLTFAGAGVGVVLWLVARSFGAVSGSSGPAAAVGTVLLAVIFLPNLLSGAVALSLGASITTGAHMALGGVARQSTASLSLVDGGGPWYLAVLLVVPPLACFLSGAAARRHLGDVSRAGPILGFAAVTYSACLAGLAAISGVTVAGPTGAEAAMGAEVGEIAALALAWAGVLGSAGWLRGNVPAPPPEADAHGSGRT